MSACSKSTTYEVYNGTSGYGMYDVKAYEYSGSNAVGFYDIGYLSANASSGSIEANKDAKQVKIAFKFVPNGDVYTTADYYNITQGSHTMILIEDHTQVIGGSKGAISVENVLLKWLKDLSNIFRSLGQNREILAVLAQTRLFVSMKCLLLQ